jgi:hypothetical protein
MALYRNTSFNLFEPIAARGREVKMKALDVQFSVGLPGACHAWPEGRVALYSLSVRQHFVALTAA